MARMFFQPMMHGIWIAAEPDDNRGLASAESPINTSRLARSPFLDTVIVSDHSPEMYLIAGLHGSWSSQAESR